MRALLLQLTVMGRITVQFTAAAIVFGAAVLVVRWVIDQWGVR